MNKINVKIYAARGMSGRDQATVVQEAFEDKMEFEENGIRVLCPVEKERVKSIHKKLSSDTKHMKLYWPADKDLIKQAHVYVNFTPHLNSIGAWHELGFARYFLYKPCVLIFPDGELPSPGNISFFEDDVVVDSHTEAMRIIKARWGTPLKRLKWRIKLLKKVPRAIYLKCREWINLV